MTATSRDDAREYFERKGLRYTSDLEYMIAYPIHRGDIMRLWQMCNDHIGEAELEMHMRPNPKSSESSFVTKYVKRTCVLTGLTSPTAKPSASTAISSSALLGGHQIRT